MSIFRLAQFAASGAKGGEVLFSADIYTGNSSTQTITNGVDLSSNGGMVWIRRRDGISNYRLFDTERGATKSLLPNITAGEQTNADTLTAFNSDGFTLGADTATNQVNYTGYNYVAWTFAKSLGVFDIIKYTGTGSAQNISHNLGVTPEMIIVKRYDTSSNWPVYHSGNGIDPETDALLFNSPNATIDTVNWWNDTAPTSSVFTVNIAADTNASGGSYIAYLFATLAGVSKVGSYTGNGTSQTIDCGFTDGAKFVLIKRPDATANWRIWDATRGIVAGNDPYLAITNAAEITSNDSVDPDNSGFIVNELGATNINTSGVNYIYLAFA